MAGGIIIAIIILVAFALFYNSSTNGNLVNLLSQNNAQLQPILSTIFQFLQQTYGLPIWIILALVLLR